MYHHLYGFYTNFIKLKQLYYKNFKLAEFLYYLYPVLSQIKKIKEPIYYKTSLLLCMLVAKLGILPQNQTLNCLYFLLLHLELA